MKKKDIVYYYIKNHTDSLRGITTSKISEDLGMQRTNTSAILNELVEEGIIIKENTRPVVYRLKREKEYDGDGFQNLIGNTGSLEKVIYKTKAELTKTGSDKRILIKGEAGTGISFYVKNIYQYAKDRDLIPEDGILYKLNIKYFLLNMEKLEDFIHGDELLKQVNNGVLFVDNIHMIEKKYRFLLYDLITLQTEHPGFILVFSMNDDSDEELETTYLKDVKSIVSLPNLNDRSMNERMELISLFLRNVSGKIQKKIIVSPALISCLLSYSCNGNVKQLKEDIESGCSNAILHNGFYKNTLEVKPEDFSVLIRTAISHERIKKYHLDNVVNMNSLYIYDEDSLSYEPISREYYSNWMDFSYFDQNENSEIQNEEHPTLLIVMQGENLADSLAGFVKQSSSNQNVISYNFPVNHESNQVYDELKNLICENVTNTGLLVLYDLITVQAIVDQIAYEIKIDVRYMHVPLTSLSLEIANLMLKFNHINDIPKSYYYRIFSEFTENFGKQKMIVTCSTIGEFESAMVRKYIKSFVENSYEVIQIPYTELNSIHSEERKISKENDIFCLVSSSYSNESRSMTLSQLFSFSNEKMKNMFSKDIDAFKNKQRVKYSNIYRFFIKNEVDREYYQPLITDFVKDLSAVYHLSNDGKVLITLKMIDCLSRQKKDIQVTDQIIHDKKIYLQIIGNVKSFEERSGCRLSQRDIQEIIKTVKKFSV